jgi:surface antigen
MGSAQWNTLSKTTLAAIPQSESTGRGGWSPGLESKGVSPLGRGYCTDYARDIYQKTTGKNLPIRGDAGQWYAAAQQAGLPTAPKTDIAKIPPGSIAVWSDGQAGHVAVVTKNEPGQLTVSEANWGGPRKDATKFERDNIITSRFDKHDERPLKYADAEGRMNGKYQLLGFILPE